MALPHRSACRWPCQGAHRPPSGGPSGADPGDVCGDMEHLRRAPRRGPVRPVRVFVSALARHGGGRLRHLRRVAFRGARIGRLEVELYRKRSCRPLGARCAQSERSRWRPTSRLRPSPGALRPWSRPQQGRRDGGFIEIQRLARLGNRSSARIVSGRVRIPVNRTRPRRSPSRRRRLARSWPRTRGTLRHLGKRLTERVLGPLDHLVAKVRGPAAEML